MKAGTSWRRLLRVYSLLVALAASVFYGAFFGQSQQVSGHSVEANPLPSRAYLPSVLAVLASNQAGHSLVPFQYVPTQHGDDWSDFTIDGAEYLAVANYFDGRSNNVDSKVLQWDGKKFVELMKLPVQGINRLHSFQIDNDHFLAATYYETAYLSILKWSDQSFHEYQRIDLSYARGVRFLNIDGERYLAVASYFDPTKGHGTNSKIYKWDGSEFVDFQNIPTEGAFRWEYFAIGGEAYLAVANSFSDTSQHNTNSVIYKWNGEQFDKFQEIGTHGAVEWKAFSIDSVPYLVIANNNDNETHNIDSIIYRWDGGSFKEFQAIPTLGAVGWESFTVNGLLFLAVANHYDSTRSSYNPDSRVYQWDGQEFVLYAGVPTHTAAKWLAFSAGGKRFLAVANAYDGSSYDQQSVIYSIDDLGIDRGESNTRRLYLPLVTREAAGW